MHAPQLIHVRELNEIGSDRHATARAAAGGSLHRVRRGSYVASESWLRLDDTQRYLALCRASSEAASVPPVLSHWSAAAVHGIPIIGPWPHEVHRVSERSSRGRSKPGMVVHPARLDSTPVVGVDGLDVTSFARTIIDLASAAPFIAAVTAADHALHRKRRGHLTIEQLYTELDDAQPLKAWRRVERVLEFSTRLSDSPAESASRVSMFVGGFVMPELQAAFADADGFIGETDFYWPTISHVGEVDGRQKYVKPEYLNGRTPGQVVYEEKLREDRLRALPKQVTRWDWNCAVDPVRLRALLLAKGIPLRRHPARRRR